MWLSWFSIYRVLTFPSYLKLNTITDAGKDLSSLQGEMAKAIDSFLRSVWKLKPSETVLSAPSFIPLSKSTPSIQKGKMRVSWSPEGILSGARGLVRSEVIHSFRYLCQFLPKGCEFSLVWGEMERSLVSSESPDFPIGKLGLKVEAAGKVRVFAMVECWTQWLLHPLHEWLFQKLALLPSDGTFDQFRPVQIMIDNGFTRFWCYDLSAATDRLPVSVQSALLNWIFGSGFGSAWAHLLVGRQYVVPSVLPKGVLVKGELPNSVRYAVGQPMGALSSWAMLALTHHFIVHWAAYRKGYTWGSFWDYAVLGDDIIIANGDVAGSYLTLMESLGVGIGIHKSLVSRRGVLEFAKRYYAFGQDCSPVPFKEVVAAIHDFECSTQFVEKYKLDASSSAGLLGLGYRVRGHLSATFDKINKKLATLGIWYASPWGILGLSTKSWLKVNSWRIDPEWLADEWSRVHYSNYSKLPREAHKELADGIDRDFKRLLTLKLCEVGYPTIAVHVFPPRQHPIYALRREEFLPPDNRVDWKSLGITPLPKLKVSWPTMDWLSTALYDIAKLSAYPGEKRSMLYNVLFKIQESYWNDSLPLLVEDIDQWQRLLTGMKYPGNGLTDDTFKEWVGFRSTSNQIRSPIVLGMKIQQKATPTVLFPTRLHRTMNRTMKR
jgi:hypothetical protein